MSVDSVYPTDQRTAPNHGMKDARSLEALHLVSVLPITTTYVHPHSPGGSPGYLSQYLLACQTVMVKYIILSNHLVDIQDTAFSVWANWGSCYT